MGHTLGVEGGKETNQTPDNNRQNTTIAYCYLLIYTHFKNKNPLPRA